MRLTLIRIFTLLALMIARPVMAQMAEDPGFARLAYLSATDPDAALDLISDHLDLAQGTPAPDPRVIHDLYHRAADILIEAARIPQAAQILMQLGDFASRPGVGINPVPAYVQAADLYESEGDPAQARAAWAAVLAAQHRAAAPAGMRAQTVAALSRLGADVADAAGEVDQIQVYFVTARAATGAPLPAPVFGAEAPTLTWGVAQISLIPETGAPGTVAAVTSLPAQTVLAKLAQAPELLLYGHGTATDFDQALKQTAQLATTTAATPLLFAWPAHGSTLDYIADMERAHRAARPLTQVLDQLGAVGLSPHVLARGLGARAILPAVARSEVPIGDLILLAPDLDAELLLQSLPELRARARQVTLYAWAGDPDLRRVAPLYAGRPRAGQGGERLVQAPGLHSIDIALPSGPDLPPPVLRDISQRIAGQAPAQRCGLLKKQADVGWRLTGATCP